RTSLASARLATSPTGPAFTIVSLSAACAAAATRKRASRLRRFIAAHVTRRAAVLGGRMGGVSPPTLGAGTAPIRPAGRRRDDLLRPGLVGQHRQRGVKPGLGRARPFALGDHAADSALAKLATPGAALGRP